MEIIVPLNREQYIAAIDQLNKLKTASAAAMAEKDEMIFIRAADMERDYILKVGSLENEILQLEHELQKLKRKTDVVREYSFDIREEDLRLIDMQVELEYAKLGNEIKNRLQKQEIIEDGEMPLPMSEESKRRITSLYIGLIRLLHPELNPDADKENLIYWHRAHAAYIQRDTEQLVRIALECAAVCEYVPSMSRPDDLAARMDRCRELTESALSACEKMRREFPFAYEERLQDEEWVHRTRLVNEGMQEYLKAAYDENLQNLNELVERKRINDK